jgi:transposase-like protein
MNNEQFEKLIGKIDMLIKLTALSILKDKSIKDKVKILYGLGLKSGEIARVIDRSKNQVYVTLHEIRKEEEKPEKEETTPDSKTQD